MGVLTCADTRFSTVPHLCGFKLVEDFVFQDKPQLFPFLRLIQLVEISTHCGSLIIGSYLDLNRENFQVINICMSTQARTI